MDRFSKKALRRATIALLGTCGLLSGPAFAQNAKPPKEPAKIKLTVDPSPVSAGESARLTVELAPIEGVKINRYPKIKVVVPAQDGLVGEASVAVGSDKPPPPDALKSNYFETLDPLELTLDLDSAAPSGKHEIDGKVTYFYCMPASGFCAPARVPVKIPVSVQ